MALGPLTQANAMALGPLGPLAHFKNGQEVREKIFFDSKINLFAPIYQPSAISLQVW